MNRSELAERLEQARVCYWGVDESAGIYLYPYERDMIIAALREHEAVAARLAPTLPSEDEIARIICGSCDVTRTNDGTFEQKYVCEVVIDCECCMARARAVLALLGKAGSDSAPALPSEEEIALDCIPGQ